MRSTRISVVHFAIGLATAAAATLSASAAVADDDRGAGPSVVTVAFGAGLNTAQPGNTANHHVLPETIRVSQGDIVNFVVAGLHVIRVYDNGVRLRDVKTQLPDECEVNPLPPAPVPPQCTFGTPVPVIPEYSLGVFYRGINPLVAPNPPPPPFAAASTAVNRVESVQFSTPGRYLVICAVLPHFNDGMTAIVEVRPHGGNSGGGGHNGHDHD